MIVLHHAWRSSASRRVRLCLEEKGLAYEGHVVNLEAMEHRKPVVATSFGGSPEVVEDGVTGFVRNPFDLEAFSDAIGRLLADPALRARLGEAGHLRLQRYFTIERLTAEFLEEYQRAIAAARPDPGLLSKSAAGGR